MASERIRYFDIAKGILIILLVFAHFRSAVGRLTYESPYFEYVYGWNNIFTCFYMPAFFLISGYCSNFKKPAKVFITSLLKSLLLPIITLSILEVTVTSLIYQQDIILNLKKSLLHGGQFWFLWALLLGKALVYMVENIKFKNWGGQKSLIITFLLLVSGVALNQYKVGDNYVYYRHALIASFWIAVGAFLHDNPKLYELSIKWSVVSYPIVAVASFLKPTDIVASIDISVLTIPLHVFYSLCGTSFLLLMCKKIEKCEWLEFWGKNSLVVYALHFIPLLFFTKLLWELLNPETLGMFVLFFIVLYAIEYSICWLLMKLFQYKPFAWLMGKF